MAWPPPPGALTVAVFRHTQVLAAIGAKAPGAHEEYSGWQRDAEASQSAEPCGRRARASARRVGSRQRTQHDFEPAFERRRRNGQIIVAPAAHRVVARADGQAEADAPVVVAPTRSGPRSTPVAPRTRNCNFTPPRFHPGGFRWGVGKAHALLSCVCARVCVQAVWKARFDRRAGERSDVRSAHGARAERNAACAPRISVCSTVSTL